MKKIFLYELLFILITLLSSCDQRSADTKLAHHAMSNVAGRLKARYQLDYIGISEAGDKEHYKKIGMSFNIYRMLSKDEGRKMLLDSIDELLKEINSTTELLPYLLPSPFKINNVEIIIYAYHIDGKKIFYPNICIFSFRREKIQYLTDIPGMKSGFYTEQNESYEDALKIVHSQLVS